MVWLVPYAKRTNSKEEYDSDDDRDGDVKKREYLNVRGMSDMDKEQKNCGTFAMSYQGHNDKINAILGCVDTLLLHCTINTRNSLLCYQMVARIIYTHAPTISLSKNGKSAETGATVAIR